MSSKPIVTLGINDAAVAAAALVVDGELRAACAEERLTRQKNQLGIPRHAIEAVLATEGLTIDDVDQLAVSSVGGLVPTMHGTPTSPSTQRFFSIYDAAFNMLASIERRWPATQALTLPSDLAARWFGRRMVQRARSAAIIEATGAEERRMKFYDHHTAHVMALAPLVGSGPTLVFTLDGEGDGLSGTVSWYRHGQIEIRRGIANGKRRRALGAGHGTWDMGHGTNLGRTAAPCRPHAALMARID